MPIAEHVIGAYSWYVGAYVRVGQILSQPVAEGATLPDIRRIGAYGSHQSSPHKQGFAAGSDVTQIHLVLVGQATRVPDPPDDMSEPAWALLLFGPAVCSVRTGVVKVDVPSEKWPKTRPKKKWG